MASNPLDPEGQRPDGTRGAGLRGQAPGQYALYATLGFQFAGTFMVLGAAGWWLDGKLGTAPWLMLVGIVLGAGGGFYSMVKKVPGGFGQSPQDRPPKQPS